MLGLQRELGQGSPGSPNRAGAQPLCRGRRTRRGSRGLLLQPRCSPPRLGPALSRAPTLTTRSQSRSFPNRILFEHCLLLKTSPLLYLPTDEDNNGSGGQPTGQPRRSGVVAFAGDPRAVYPPAVICQGLQGSAASPRAIQHRYFHIHPETSAAPTIPRSPGDTSKGSAKRRCYCIICTALKNCTFSTTQIPRMVPPSTRKTPRVVKLLRLL